MIHFISKMVKEIGTQEAQNQSSISQNLNLGNTTSLYHNMIQDDIIIRPP